MIAAIYARKNTEQNDADAKSVARQIESAFASVKGWTIVEVHVYSDDAVSGALVTARPSGSSALDLMATVPGYTRTESSS